MSDGSEAAENEPSREGEPSDLDPLDRPTPPPSPLAAEGAVVPEPEATLAPPTQAETAEDEPESNPEPDGGFDPEATLAPPTESNPDPEAGFDPEATLAPPTQAETVEDEPESNPDPDAGFDPEATLAPPTQSNPDPEAGFDPEATLAPPTPEVAEAEEDDPEATLAPPTPEVAEAEEDDPEATLAPPASPDALASLEALTAEGASPEVDAEARVGSDAEADLGLGSVASASASDPEASNTSTAETAESDAEAVSAAPEPEGSNATAEAEATAVSDPARAVPTPAASDVSSRDAEVAAMIASLGGDEPAAPKKRRATERVPLSPFLSRLEVPTPAVLEDRLEYNTLVDVQEHLLSTLEDDQEDAFLRAFPRARSRVHQLEEDGHDVGELDERLMLAGLLSGQGDHLGALQAVEEVLVIAKVLDEVGVIEAYEPPPQLSEERVKELLTDELAPLRVRFERQLTQATDAWRARMNEHVEDRLDELLGEDRFAEAASAATAARPQELLERPEVIARIDAVASRLDLSLLVSSNFFERVDKLVRERVARFVDGGQLQSLIDGLIERRVEELASASVDAQVRGVLSELEHATASLDSTIASQVQLALADDAFLAQVDARARAALAEPDSLGRLEQQVLDSEELVPTLLGNDEFQIGLETRTSALLETGLFRETLEGNLRESQALAEAVLDGLGSTSFGEQLDKRIAERTAEALEHLERVVAETRAEAPTNPGVASRPQADPGELKAMVMEAMADKDFRRNVDNRVEELAHRGFLVRRIEEVVRKEISVANLVPDERLSKFVTKELANRQALQQAALTGDGLADQSSLSDMIEDKVKAFLVAQVKKKKTTKKKATKKKR